MTSSNFPEARNTPGLKISSVHELNAIPKPMREALYLRLIPNEIFARFRIDRETLKGPLGHEAVRIVAFEGKPWARVEMRATPVDRDPLLMVDLSTSPFSVPELTFVQITDPISERFGIDRTEDGQDTLFGTVSRNLAEELRALQARLAPGQVRRGLRLLGRVLECMEEFCRLLGVDLFLVEPLFYHSAIIYERHGCGYFFGRELMDEIHDGFAPGGVLAEKLDGSSPFRQPGFEMTVRGRSWAIHDGILGRPWGEVKMYKAVGTHANISTFPGGVY